LVIAQITSAEPATARRAITSRRANRLCAGFKKEIRSIKIPGAKIAKELLKTPSLPVW